MNTRQIIVLLIALLILLAGLMIQSARELKCTSDGVIKGIVLENNDTHIITDEFVYLGETERYYSVSVGFSTLRLSKEKYKLIEYIYGKKCFVVDKEQGDKI